MLLHEDIASKTNKIWVFVMSDILIYAMREQFYNMSVPLVRVYLMQFQLPAV